MPEPTADLRDDERVVEWWSLLDLARAAEPTEVHAAWAAERAYYAEHHEAIKRGIEAMVTPASAMVAWDKAEHRA